MAAPAALVLLACAGQNSDLGNPEYRVFNGTVEAIWQWPSRRPQDALGLAFMVHGSGSSARKFFLKSAACPACRESLNYVCMVRRVLEAGLGFFVVSAPDRTWLNGRTWGPRGGWVWPRDRWLLEWAIPFAQRLAPAKRLVLMSMSSASVPALDLLSGPFGRAFAAHAMLIPAALPARAVSRACHPPTLLWYNPRDSDRARAARKTVRILRRAGAPTAVVLGLPQRLGPGYFARCMPGIVNFSLSVAMYRALRSEGLLDADDRLIRYLPFPTDEEVRRGLRWHGPMRPFAAQIGDTLAFHDSHLEACMGLAYGYHGTRCGVGMGATVDLLLRALSGPVVRSRGCGGEGPGVGAEAAGWPREWLRADRVAEEISDTPLAHGL